jgi:pimeloyl-ACP methyl ester carboxylesterase
LVAVAALAVAALLGGATVRVGWVQSVALASHEQRPATAPMPSEERARLERRPVDTEHLVRVWTIVYRSYDGFLRHAYVVLPRWYGPKNNPPVPLVISPHGRGVPATRNVRMWGDLPAIGRFAVVNPEGQGRRLTLYSWGDPEEIHDLSRMPRFIHEAMPWLRIAKDRVYAFGSSMGGQETLLLVARYPEMLDGAAAFDSPTNLKARYYSLPGTTSGSGTRALLRLELGGAPSQVPHAYAIRSPLDWAKQIAFSRLPLQIWWSTQDHVVTDQVRESGLLYRTIRKLNPAAPVLQFVGTWQHSAEMRRVLPKALALFGLMPPFHTHAPGLTI